MLEVGSVRSSDWKDKRGSVFLRFARMQEGALQHLEAFASFNGPDYYGMPRNTRKLRLVRRPWVVPSAYPFSEAGTVVPMLAGEKLQWQVELQ